MSEVDCITEVGRPRQLHCPFQEREETPLSDTGGGARRVGHMQTRCTHFTARDWPPVSCLYPESQTAHQHLLCRICTDQTPSQPRFSGCWVPAPAALHPSPPVSWTKTGSSCRHVTLSWDCEGRREVVPPSTSLNCARHSACISLVPRAHLAMRDTGEWCLSPYSPWLLSLRRRVSGCWPAAHFCECEPPLSGGQILALKGGGGKSPSS